MIIVVPVSKTDDEVVDDFIRVFNLFGPYENHDLIVVSRPSDTKEGRKVYRALEHNNFKDKTHWVFDEDGRCGWPGGPNHYWVETINFLAEEYGGDRSQPWLWLEMDMTPIKRGWADTLEEGYNNCGKPFMGNLAWTTTTTTEDDKSHEMLNLCKHLVGAAIYPPAAEMDKYSKIWRKVNRINTAWDVLLQWELPQHTHDTKLIQMLFRTGNYQRIKSDTGRWIVQGEDREPWPDPNYTFTKPVDIKNAVIVHGCNDGSLARMVCEDVTGEKTIDELSKDITYDTSKDKVSKRKLPVFFHTPKNGGTYINNTCFTFMRDIANRSRRKCHHIDVVSSDLSNRNGTFSNFRFLYIGNPPTDNKYRKAGRRNGCYEVNIEDLDLSDFIDNIFLLRISAAGFRNYKENIYSLLPDNVEPYEFMCLREPYSRTQSLYTYINSEEGKHEPTYNAFGCDSFPEYINSKYFEESWLLRNLLNLPDDTIITQQHFDEVCNLLNEMHVFNMNNIDESLAKIFKQCYNFNTDTVKKRPVYDNRTSNKNSRIKYYDLDEQTQKVFLEKTKWDQKIYNKYVC